jgi:hypothetical protein
MERIVNIQIVDPKTLQLQTYADEDTSLISNTEIEITFDPSQDYLEYFVLDLNQNVLYSNTAGYPYYQIQDNDIVIDPQRDLELQGFTEGQYYTIYNFLKRKLASSPNQVLYIQDISTDRTELRLNTTQISNINIVELTTQLAIDINDASKSYQDFYLDFGDNKLIIATNIALDNTNPNDPTVLIKLYEPLPNEFTFQSKCWIVEQAAESKAYNIELLTIFTVEEQLNYIQGPNYNLDVKDQTNNSTTYQNYNTLVQNSSTAGSGSLLFQINSLLAEKGIEINIDYSDYSEFVHFSSALTRLENFYYKLSLIEQYTASSSLSNITVNNNYVSGIQIVWDNKINDIITNFDGYEYYLYFSSESHAWPKTNSSPPYINYKTTSVTASNWFAVQSTSASLYDSENNNALINTIPSYLKEDPTNLQYELFLQMIGQNFDNVWIYLKDVTNKFDADNRLNYGISKDMVAQAIRDLGVNLYQNNFSESDIYSALIGLTTSGSTLLIPYATSSLPTPTGYEYINTYITASNTQEPLDDVNKEIYKRIYHNLPALLKKKGTPESLRLLINIYGIPDTIFRINEFGGKSNDITNTWDNFQNQFNYAYNTNGNGFVKVPIKNSSFGGTVQGAYMFRFKTSGVPINTGFSQSLLRYETSVGDAFNVVLEYTGSGYTSGSYSGSIIDPYYQYGTLKLLRSTNSASLYLPFFDGGWWSVLVNASTIPGIADRGIYAGNSIYGGYDGNSIGFYDKSIGFSVGNNLTNSHSLSLPASGSLTLNGKTYTSFSGSLQELRYYGTYLSESIFYDFIMNPYSIEENRIRDYDSKTYPLKFRAPLGSVLDNDISQTTRTSIHPSVTGSYSSVSSFTLGSTYSLSGSFSFIPNTEIIYQDQFSVGVKNAITEKIKIVNTVYPSGDTLSPYISIQQTSYISESFNRDVNYVEAGFSPQDEVNDDIISQLGSFNIGEYIGDPRQVSSSLTYYPDFNRLRDEYFSKYISNYNLWDYIRLIKFYDNSLFKMIKDFTPARASLATGIIIKQTLLERNKYPLPQVTTNSEITFVGSPTSRTLNIKY